MNNIFRLKPSSLPFAVASSGAVVSLSQKNVEKFNLMCSRGNSESASGGEEAKSHTTTDLEGAEGLENEGRLLFLLRECKNTHVVLTVRNRQ